MIFRRRPAEDRASASPLARRQRALIAISLAAALVSTGGLIASTKVKSPAQLAADTREPEPTVLTAEVVREVLSTTLVMRGVFSGGRQFKFTPASVATTSHGPGATTLIVTAVHTRVGATVTAGKVLLEVSERPVYALPGKFPAYRDMVPGQTGKDIAQLQAGLRQLGYRSSDRKGFFGAGTKGAVTRFYRDLGYPVPLVAADRAAPEGGNQPAPSTSPSPPAAQPDPMVPMSEVAFLPTLPARVAGFAARVGDTVGNPLITFSTGGLNLTARLNPAYGPLVKVGMTASIASETTGFTGEGTIESIGKKTTTTTAANGETTYVPLRITRSAAWPRDLQSEDVRITITTASTEGPVLAVPEAAISSAADGRTTVTVVAADGSQRLVEVTAGVSADGMVEVSPVAGELEPGDQVVTGAGQPAGTEVKPSESAVSGG